MIAMAVSAQAASYPFTLDRSGEAVANLVMSCPGADWSKAGHEAAMADVRVDNGAPFQVMLYGGDAPRKYSVFLGHLEAGKHEITVEQNRTYSAPQTSVKIVNVYVSGGLEFDWIQRAPILYARKNTIGKFTDVPVLVYAERLQEGGKQFLQYTVIFTNEDGGTSTRALMARWGRTTDIEYVYRLDIATGRAIIQGRGHKDIEYGGKLEGAHPLLIPVTDNNMVADEVPSEVRYQIAPILVDLSTHSRELVMDEDPLTYALMSMELEREGKLRQFGVVDGQKISDVRNYLYIEAKIAVVNSGLVTLVRRKDEAMWRSSALGRMDYAVDRDGWIRTTVELPPGTRPDQLGEIGFGCQLVPDADKRMPVTGSCRVDAVSKVFFLQKDYRPGPSLWSHNDRVEISAGEIKTFRMGAR